MKKLFLVLFAFLQLCVFGQNQTFTGVKTFTSPPRFTNLTQGGIHDSIQVVSTFGTLKYVKRSDLLSGMAAPTLEQVLSAGNSAFNQFTLTDFFGNSCTYAPTSLGFAASGGSSSLFNAGVLNFNSASGSHSSIASTGFETIIPDTAEFMANAVDTTGFRMSHFYISDDNGTTNFNIKGAGAELDSGLYMPSIYDPNNTSYSNSGVLFHTDDKKLTGLSVSGLAVTNYDQNIFANYENEQVYLWTYLDDSFSRIEKGVINLNNSDSTLSTILDTDRLKIINSSTNKNIEAAPNGLVVKDGTIHKEVTLKADGLYFNTANSTIPTYLGKLTSAGLSAARTWTMPNKSGTVAMLDDITGGSAPALDAVLTTGNTSSNFIEADGGYKMSWDNGGMNLGADDPDEKQFGFSTAGTGAIYSATARAIFGFRPDFAEISLLEADYQNIHSSSATSYNQSLLANALDDNSTREAYSRIAENIGSNYNIALSVKEPYMGTGKFSDLSIDATNGLSFRTGVGSTSTAVAKLFMNNLDAVRTYQLLNTSGDIPVIGTTAPSSSTDTGITGEIRITDTYIYHCIATNTWVRGAVESTF